MPNFIYIAQMDIDPEHEEAFNRIYDTQHIPEILKVPGVFGCRRFKLEWAKLPGLPSYVAIYELASVDVIKQPEWIAALEYGDWPAKVRPHTKNRLHGIYRALT